MGGVTRSGGQHGIGQGFAAGLLLGFAVVVLVAPPPRPAAPPGGQGSLPATSVATAPNSERKAVAAAEAAACAGALALEQGRRSVLEGNVAGLEHELKALRDSRDCASECQQEPQPMSNPPFARGALPPRAHDRDGSLTVATHLTADRLSSLDQLCRLYPGRIAASVFVDERNLSVLERWCEEDTACECADPQRSRLALRYTLKDELSRFFGQLYPVNSLRNQALRAVETEFALGLDADFVVGGPTDAIPRPPPRTVYVLPCFKVSDRDLKPGDKSIAWPLTKAALLEWKRAERVVGYDAPDWPLGHADVDYGRWANATERYAMDRANIYFEPYFVARAGELPFYDERYRGYGSGDKALHFHLMYKMGFRVEVLPDHFVLHLPHEENEWRGVPERGTRQEALRHMYIGFHNVERMSMGVHQIDFWTRVVGNCVPEGCRRSYCSPLVPELSGGERKCRTQPERYFQFPPIGEPATAVEE